ncbi:MAG TPA: Gfo/Idh/MocA family oxidoreductase [Polyangiaceae bacterium]|nr:Gfo/Idh/MocA family oxidoreductase [Polyangiaceae bacterium]
MSKRVRVGVVGLGAIAERAHLPHFAALPSAQLTAVSSSRPRALRAACARYSIAHGYGDWRELVASDAVEAVAVCTPNDTHAAIALAALLHGKHVLVEKPIATRSADAARMVAVARAERRVLAVHHNLRFHPVAVAAYQLLRRAALGRVIGFEGVLSHRGPKGWAPQAAWFFDPARVGGGALLDLGVHAFDLLHHFVGEKTERIAAVCLGAAKRSGGSAEHQASCLLTLANGAIGTVSVSWRDSTYRNRWYFAGERGALELDFTGEGRLLLHRASGVQNVALPPAAPTAQRAFVERVLGKSGSRATPGATGEDGLLALNVSLAALRAARSKGSVRLQSASRSRS